MKIGIYLAQRPIDCRVIIDGQDISRYCVGVELRAHVHEGITRVGLELMPLSVEVLGDAGEIIRTLYQPTTPEPES